MKRQWLYHPETGVGTLYESEEAIAKAISDGYKDTPAKCGENADEGSNVDIVAILGLTVDELKDMYTVKELKEIAKALNITGMSNKNQDEVAIAISEYKPEDL